MPLMQCRRCTSASELLLQVTHLLGKPLLRVFGQMRRILQIEPGWGLNIVPPPVPRSHQVCELETPRTCLIHLLIQGLLTLLVSRAQGELGLQAGGH